MSHMIHMTHMTQDEAVDLLNRWQDEKAFVAARLVSRLAFCHVEGLITDASTRNVSIESGQVSSPHGVLGVSLEAENYIYDEQTDPGPRCQATLTLIYASGEFCGIQKLRKDIEASNLNK
jgi:hypothetical protein